MRQSLDISPVTRSPFHLRFYSLIKSAFAIALVFAVYFEPANAALTQNEVIHFQGMFTYDIAKNPGVIELFKSTLRASFAQSSSEKLVKLALADLVRVEVSTPARFVEGRYLIATGCVAHDCGSNRSMIVIDAHNPTALLIVRKSMDLNFPVSKPKGFAETMTVIASAGWEMMFGPGLNGLAPEILAEINAL